MSSDSINVLGRHLDRAYHPNNSVIPPNAPDIDSRYRSFTLSSPPDNPDKPIPLGSGALFGPVIEGVLPDGTAVAVKTFVQTKDEFTRDLLAECATLEYRRGRIDLGPRFARARALVEVMDHDLGTAFLLVMDLVDGVDLERLPLQPFDHETQRAWTRDALEALTIMSDRGLIQQDVKPANIMATRNGLVFIDHGSMRADLPGTVTNRQSTQMYHAPEYHDTDTFTTETMTFSIGLTLLELFTGMKPYKESDLNRGGSSVTKSRISRRTRIGTLNLDHPDLDPTVRELLTSMTDRDPAARGNPHELYRALASDRSATTIDIRQTTKLLQSDPGTTPTGPSPVVAPYSQPLQFNPLDDHAKQGPRLVRRPSGGSDPQPPEMVSVEPFSLALKEEPPEESSVLIDFAGVDSTAVSVPAERRNYRFIGVALMVYAVYIIAGSMAIAHQMTGDTKIALIGGGIVGAILAVALVNFDRSIVNALNANLTNLEDPKQDENPTVSGFWFWASMFVRVVVTLFIAFLIGETLIVEIHRDDVAGKVAEYVQVDLATLTSDIEAEYGTFPTCTATDPPECQPGAGRRNELAQATADAKQAAETARSHYETEPLRLEKQADLDARGLGSTRTRGCPPGGECRTLLEAAQKIRDDYPALRDQLAEDIRTAEKSQRDLEEEILTATAQRRADIERARGPITQTKAFWDLMWEEWLLRLKAVALIAVFMAIELFAVLMKLWMRGNSYERAQARRARVKELAHVKGTGLERARISEAEAANRDLLTYEYGLNSALKIQYLEEHAKRLSIFADGPAAPSASSELAPTLNNKKPRPPTLDATLPHVSGQRSRPSPEA